ncbi:ATP-binding cassette, subfamily B, bacterial [Enterococcus sp. AZ194]|uniref:ATP-binding cassette domain-containing protein n=1 Tax=Enterococcus sp. AZ194 TaxID=2774629 RepID=UPI003F240303
MLLKQLSVQLHFSFTPFFLMTVVYHLFQQLPLYIFNVWMYAKVITLLLNGFQWQSLLPFLLGTWLFMIISNLFCSLYEYVYQPIATEKVSTFFLKHLIQCESQLSWNELEETKFRNNYLFYTQNGQEMITGYLDCLASLVASTILILLTGSLILTIDPLLILILGFSLISTFFGNKKMGKLQSSKQEKQISLTNQFSYYFGTFSNIRAIRDIRINHLDSLLKEKLSIIISKLSKQQTFENKRIFRQRLIFSYVLSDTFLKVVGPLLLIIKLFVQRTINLAGFVSAYNAFNLMFQSLSSLLGSGLTNFFFNQQRVDNLTSFLLELKNLNENFFPTTELTTEKIVQLKAYSFIYPDSEKEVLKNIDLTVNKHEKILIVGENGSGKSTLLKVLMNQYRLNSENGKGSLIFNDKMNGQKINYQAQHFQMYPISLGMNVSRELKYNETKVSSLFEQLKLVPELKELQKRPVGRHLFTNGIELSGGETQKIVLARSLWAKDKELLFFDEPLSQIDHQIQPLFFDLLANDWKEKTVIMISHSLEYASSFDRILVMKNGRIDTEGIHEQLLESSQLYKNLYTVGEIQGKKL